MLVGYARVSTHDQNPEYQTDALHAAGVERLFEEQASGAQRDRPQLAAALDYMRAGDTLVVWRLDRLARSLKQLIETVQRLETAEINFKSLSEDIDTSTAGGRLVFHIFGALAEFEHSLIRTRTNAGLAAARARGRRGGRPAALTAADKKQATALMRDPDITMAEIAERLDCAVSTLHRHFPGGRSGQACPRED